ncbi:DUF6471 domain-containing protein [Pandoraea sputorum]|uniref:DUF6471 domain-containing protein n=2 Tax=Pandoraea sputorum TaxID=93222 RepID=UPI001CD649DA
MSHTDTDWTRLASRCARGVMVRKGVTYDDVAQGFASLGIEESLRGLNGKIQRGSFQCSFFLQLLCACGAAIPRSWAPHLTRRVDWCESSRRIYIEERRAVARASSLPVAAVEAALAQPDLALVREGLLERGTFPFTWLLQLAAFAPVPAIELYLDRDDIVAAARANAIVFERR